MSKGLAPRPRPLPASCVNSRCPLRAPVAAAQGAAGAPTVAAGRSSWPMWTPTSGPAASATSTRSFTRSGTPAAQHTWAGQGGGVGGVGACCPLPVGLRRRGNPASPTIIGRGRNTKATQALTELAASIEQTLTCAGSMRLCRANTIMEHALAPSKRTGSTGLRLLRPLMPHLFFKHICCFQPWGSTPSCTRCALPGTEGRRNLCPLSQSGLRCVGDRVPS